MNETRIPVDLQNPGQVFASLGFLETAYALCGCAEGGFDWTNGADTGFVLATDEDRNPFEAALEFLVDADVSRLAPLGDSNEYEDPARVSLTRAEAFPRLRPDGMALPIRLEREGQRLDLTHWCDGSSRDDFKLYAGNRSAARIAEAMLGGDDKKKTKGVRTLWLEDKPDLVDNPFDVVTSLGGSFNLDPRAAWTRLDAGYSPNDHKHSVAGSPAVEILAAIGLEHARPRRVVRSGEVRYAVWGGLLPPSLARAALGCSEVPIPLRTFRFTLARPTKQTKAVTFSREEIA